MYCIHTICIFFFPQLCVSEEGTRWSKYFFLFHVCLYSNIKPSRADPPCHGRSTVPSSLSPVVNIHSLIHPVQCQQFKRAQFVFLSTSISVIPLWVARSHFRTWVPSKGLNTWGFQNVSAGMTQYFARVVQCNKTLQIQNFNNSRQLFHKLWRNSMLSWSFERLS